MYQNNKNLEIMKFNYDQKKVDLIDYLNPICLEYKGYSIKLYNHKNKTFLTIYNDKGEKVLSCTKKTKVSILKNIESRINFLETNK